MNTYDNSIVYTDYLLGEMIQRMNDRKGISFLVYFSDHGETPNSTAWRDSANPDLFKVPFVIWFSPEYRRKFPGVVKSIEKAAKEPLRLDHAKAVLRLLAGVET